MTRLFLAAGVAALAITAPASAKPDREGGGGRAQVAKQERAQRPQRVQRVERMAMPRVERSQRFERRVERPQRFAAFQQRQERRVERVRTQRAERIQNRAIERRSAERRQIRENRIERAQARASDRHQVRANRAERVQNRSFERQQLRAQRVEQARNRAFERQQLRSDRAQQQTLARQRFDDRRLAEVRNGFGVHDREHFHFNHEFASRYYGANGRGLTNGCPPGLWAKGNGCMPPGQAMKLLGNPLARASSLAALAALPPAVSYLYPDTRDYYYRYGDGYLYRVNRADNVIASLLPLMAGGYLPGQYLPNYYMSSYVPSYYGFNSFYPDYGNDCYRYGYGVVYETDCYTGLVEDVIPLYAGGYGVGQMLPSAYNYYNVPMQYRPLYYDTPDYGYWYSPGAIYQYDRGSSLITSVAALMSPGFTVGQPLPMGYNVYNVPYAYRATYYDTPNAWYRYNNGYIYQVDPVTQLVTAIVASILS